jgi:hypothetical protein
MLLRGIAIGLGARAGERVRIAIREAGMTCIGLFSICLASVLNSANLERHRFVGRATARLRDREASLSGLMQVVHGLR